MPEPDYIVNPNTREYQQLLHGLQVLRGKIAARLVLFERLPRAKQLAWLRKDPLFKKTLVLARRLVKHLDMEIGE